MSSVLDSSYVARELPKVVEDIRQISLRNFLNKFCNEWIDLFETFMDKSALDWSLCTLEAILLFIAYLCFWCLLRRRGRQSTGWTIIAFIFPLAMVYMGGDKDLSDPKTFFVWLFCISLTWTDVLPLHARTSLSGFHTIIIVVVALSIALALSWFSQNKSYLPSTSIGIAFPLASSASLYIWRALLVQTDFLDDVDSYIMKRRVQDVLEYAGRHLPAWTGWISENTDEGENTDVAPLTDVVVVYGSDLTE